MLADYTKFMKKTAKINITYPYEQFRLMHHVFAFVKREPTRSRRILQLFYANWLAHCDDPPATSPKLVGNAESVSKSNSIWFLYMTSPNNLNSARTIEPEKLFAWLESTSLFWQFFARYPDNMSVIALERQGRAVLIVVLAERISTIENGKPPESINELVPKYLDRIPADYADIKIKTP